MDCNGCDSWVSADTPLTALRRAPVPPGQAHELTWLCVGVEQGEARVDVFRVQRVRFAAPRPPRVGSGLMAPHSLTGRPPSHGDGSASGHVKTSRLVADAHPTPTPT